MRKCKLQNGTNISKELVDKIISNMYMLLGDRTDDAVLSIYDLGKKAHNPSYKIHESNKKALKEVKLLDENGEMTTEVQNVIQSTISFDGCNEKCYKLGDPIKEILDYIEILGNN